MHDGVSEQIRRHSADLKTFLLSARTTQIQFIRRICTYAPYSGLQNGLDIKKLEAHQTVKIDNYYGWTYGQQ